LSYQTSIPDDFVPPQYIDERFTASLATYSANGHRPGDPWVVAIPRPDLDPASRVRYDMSVHTEYDIKAKTDKVAVLQVLAAGRGRVRLGWREQVPVTTGDLVLVNLREAGHWIYIRGMLCYYFTAEVAMARMYRTTKPRVVDLAGATDAELRAAREVWEDQLFWNIKDILNDYMLLGRDPKAETEYRNGPETRIELTQSALGDGMPSDNSRDNRFPIVYRRVLGVGPGRGFRREDDLGFPEYVHSRSEAVPGDMLAYCRTVRAAEMTFQGSPIEFIHASSLLDLSASRGRRVEMHQSCASAVPWDVPSEVDSDEDDALRGRTG
jgi:hypothetical protein